MVSCKLNSQVVVHLWLEMEDNHKEGYKVWFQMTKYHTFRYIFFSILQEPCSLAKNYDLWEKFYGSTSFPQDFLLILCGTSKINNFQPKVVQLLHIEKDIIGFDISVDDIFAMEISNNWKNFFGKGGCLDFGITFHIVDLVKNISSRT